MALVVGPAWQQGTGRLQGQERAASGSLPSLLSSEEDSAWASSAETLAAKASSVWTCHGMPIMPA
jgi:hypothetical protein